MGWVYIAPEPIGRFLLIAGDVDMNARVFTMRQAENVALMIIAVQQTNEIEVVAYSDL